MGKQSRQTAGVHPALSELFRASKDRGWLSYEELNNAIPDEMVDPDRVHELLALVDDLSIELVDELEYRARLFRARREAGRERRASSGR
jgi:RNA polymerase primary sigma factor